MKAFIRTDASNIIGSGHVTRSLALATALKNNGAQVHFICKELEGDLIPFLTGRGFPVSSITGCSEKFVAREDAEKTADIINRDGGAHWLVIDISGANAEWEDLVRPCSGRILSVDDLALAKRNCDLLLNYHYLPGVEAKYGGYRTLLGPQYALLRPEFIDARKSAESRIGDIRRILVSFGGGSAPSVIAKTFTAIETVWKGDIETDLVIGPSATGTSWIDELTEKREWINLHISPPDMAELTTKADLAIGAYGVSTMERALLGVPSLIITIAKNQEIPAKALANGGYAIYSGPEERVTMNNLSATLRDLSENRELLANFSDKGMKLVDGAGACRVALAMGDYDK